MPSAARPDVEGLGIEHEGEALRAFRVQRYRVKAAYYFTCQHEGCAVDHATRVVNLDGSPWTPDQERTDDELTVRCRAHRSGA